MVQDRVVVADRSDLYNIAAKFATIEYTIAKVVDKSAKIPMPISVGLALSYKIEERRVLLAVPLNLDRERVLVIGVDVEVH